MPQQLIRAFQLNSKLLASLGICAGAAGASYWAGTGLRHPRPATEVRLVFEPAQIDLGDQPFGYNTDFSVRLANRTSRRVRLISVESTCECATFEKPSAGGTVSPDHALVVQGILHVRDRPGVYLVQVSALSENGERSEAVLRVNSVGTWDLSPAVLDFGEVLLDEAEDNNHLHRNVRYTSDVDDLLAVRTSASWLSANVILEKEGPTIRVEIAPNLLADGGNAATVTVESSSPALPTKELVVTVQGVRGLTAMPAMVCLSTLNPSELVFVSDRNGLPADIIDVRVSGCPVMWIHDSEAIEFSLSESPSLPCESIAILTSSRHTVAKVSVVILQGGLQ